MVTTYFDVNEVEAIEGEALPDLADRIGAEIQSRQRQWQEGCKESPVFAVQLVQAPGGWLIVMKIEE